MRYKVGESSFVSNVVSVTVEASTKKYYSVDITWGDLCYKYNGSWSTTTLGYEPLEGTIGWSLVTPGMRNVTVTLSE